MKYLRSLVVAALLAALSVQPAAFAQDASVQSDVYSQRGTGRVVSQAGGGAAYNQRFRVTLANVNAGVTLMPARARLQYRMVDVTMIAVGGAVITCTAVTISGTQGTAAVLLSVAVAALTQSAAVKPNTANATILADGASFVANDKNTAITIGKTGGTCATATHVDVIFTYALES